MMSLAELPNPFQDNVVHDAWQAPADVVDVNGHVFDACLAGLTAAQRGMRDSLIIHGSAGSGKTHLLSRFQRHLHSTAGEANDHILRCVFVFVRLQTSPQQLWQHVRRRLASDLVRRDEGLTQLQRLVAHQIAERSHTSPRSEVMRLRILGKESHDVISAHMRHLAQTLELPRDLCIVLEHILCNRAVMDAAAWLRGDGLPERVLAELGLAPDDVDDREQASRDIVLALARLAAGTLPIVVCFDQVEALQRAHDDSEAFFRFGRLAADLHDTDSNVFVITCLQSGLLQPFEAAVRDADKDRFMRRSVVIKDLAQNEVVSLIRARLDSVPELAALRRARPEAPHFPFDQAFMDALASESPCVPRRVLSRAKRRFEELQHGQAALVVDPKQFLTTLWGKREPNGYASLDAAGTTSILLKSTEILATAGELPVEEGRDGADLVLRAAKPVALSVRNEVDGRSLTPRLKALVGQVGRSPDRDWVLVRDPRLAISKAAVKAREHLAALTAAGVRLVEPSVAALRALDALSSILADAKAGDLANEGETVTTSQVLEWLRALRSDLTFEPIRELLDEILEGGAVSDSALEQDLAALLARHRVLEAERAAQEISRSVSDVVALGQRMERRFLVLNGPPAVLVDVSGVSSEVGGAA